MPLKRVLELLTDLVAFPSVSSTTNMPATNYLQVLLDQSGFRTEIVSYRDERDVEKQNLIATIGTGSGGVLYCAHTDVVPADVWTHSDAGPFKLVSENGKYYGRGSCDMKGSLSCFLTALEELDLSQVNAPVSVICTADEETGYQGARLVAAKSAIYRELVSQQPLSIIGEPTSLEVVHAHKGIYIFEAISRGRAGHSSTDEGINANVNMIPFLAEMEQIRQETLEEAAWQHELFEPNHISWNIGINDFTYASNVTPEKSRCTVSFRPMPGQAPQELLERAHQTAIDCGLEFYTKCAAPPLFVEKESFHIQSMLELTDTAVARTVGYGTDGAMFPELKKLVVCGPGDIAQAHTEDEWIAEEQLSSGVDLYRRVIESECLSK